MRLQGGHASARVETGNTLETYFIVEAASMGPRVFTRGNSKIPQPSFFELAASMGPRVFTRGNAANLLACFSSPFVLQWGHASSRVETGKRKTPRNFNI